MPGWSPEIANEFIRLAAARSRRLNQLQLQALVYIAHGWSLASFDRPLTGDRPEAWRFGPMYKRLADALTPFGNDGVPSEIEAEPDLSEPAAPLCADLEQIERDLIAEIHENYSSLESWQLSSLTRKGGTPWARIFADGKGEGRDIPHNLVKAQFAELLSQSEMSRTT